MSAMQNLVAVYINLILNVSPHISSENENNDGVNDNVSKHFIYPYLHLKVTKEILTQLKLNPPTICARICHAN